MNSTNQMKSSTTNGQQRSLSFLLSATNPSQPPALPGGMLVSTQAPHGTPNIFQLLIDILISGFIHT